MRKIIIAITAAVMAAGLTGCGETAELSVENSSSQLYTEEDMDNGLKNISERMVFMHAELDRVSYLGDDYCSGKEVLENINSMGDRADREAKEYTECMGFIVDAHYPKSPDVVFEHVLDGDWAYITMPKLKGLNILYARVGDGAWEEVYMGDRDLTVLYD